MREFVYECPGNIADALAAVSASPNRVFLAGGTNVVDHMKLGVVSPDGLIDLRHLPYEGIDELGEGVVRIGALVRNSDLANAAVIRHGFPALSRALLSGASGQIRNMATTGGNLLQRTRCVYFRDTAMPCNKRTPGAGCSAIGGHNRESAILGASESCVATHPSDMAVALAAYDADINVIGAQGQRSIPIVDFYTISGDRPDHDTNLERDEIVVSIDLQYSELTRNSVYRKVRDRASYAFALVSAAVAVELNGDGTIREARIALGGVAPGPWRASRAEALLRGGMNDRELFKRAITTELTQASPLSQNEYKISMVRNIVISALSGLLDHQSFEQGGA